VAVELTSMGVFRGVTGSTPPIRALDVRSTFFSLATWFRHS